MNSKPVASSPVDGASGAQDTSSVIARWQRMRTSRIERRALALANLGNQNRPIGRKPKGLNLKKSGKR